MFDGMRVDRSKLTQSVNKVWKDVFIEPVIQAAYITYWIYPQVPGLNNQVIFVFLQIY